MLLAIPPAILSKIRLELARTPEFPKGSPKHGYELVAPLTKDEHIHEKNVIEVKHRCPAVEFWGGELPEEGVFRRTGTGWQFDTVTEAAKDDEPFDIDRHLLSPTTYITIRSRDGVQRPFRVVSIEPVVL